MRMGLHCAASVLFEWGSGVDRCLAVTEVQSDPARWPNPPQKPARGSSSGAAVGDIF